MCDWKDCATTIEEVVDRSGEWKTSRKSFDGLCVDNKKSVHVFRGVAAGMSHHFVVETKLDVATE